jgi:hypothetical protein
MKHLSIFHALLILSLLSACSSSSRKWRETEHHFQTMPMSARPNPLWFWNNSKVEPAELKRQIAGYKEAGYGGLSILPFGKNFKPEYLSEEYFEAYRVCMEEARKSGMTLWIYDEYGFPSGTAGDINGDGRGRFKEKYPAHTNKRLDKFEYIPAGETKTLEQTLPPGELMAAVAMDTLTNRRIDLTPLVADGKLKWNAPGEHWKVMIFTCTDAGNTIVDYMSPEAVAHYIQMTHDEYLKRFGEYFGTTVVGTFFDEPTLYYAAGRSWTSEFNRKFEAAFGFSPALYYPALWYDIGEETAEARNYLFGFRSALYAEGYPRLVSEWSRKHGIVATGHQDNEEILNCVGISGDLMKCFKYQDAPGIDKIGGNRPAERFYKIISSAAYNWDHHLVMSETYGAMGNISWNTIFAIAMDQYVKGINLLIPHAVWYDTAQVRFLPELSLRNPLYADSLRIFTDYLARLNILLQNDARWEGDIAVLYPIHTMQSGHYMDGPAGYYRGGVIQPGLDYTDVGTALFDSLGYDFMFLHPETLDEQCRIVQDKLVLENSRQTNAFTTLVIPGSSTISLSNLTKIQAFVQAGGNLVFTSQIPHKATIAAEDLKVVEIMRELLNSPATVFVKKPDPLSLKAAMVKFADKYALNFTDNLSLCNIHKVFNDKNLWFFANPETTPKTVDIELKGEYDLRLWNPHTGDTNEPFHAERKNGKTTFQLRIEGNKSLFVVEK